MFKISRLNKSRLANWWWTVDKMTLGVVLAIMFIGSFLLSSASPSVARKLIMHKNANISEYHFIIKQIPFLFLSVISIVVLSMLNLKTTRRLAIIGYIGALFLTIATIFVGFETKGSSRWISLGFMSLQPSEFIKPTFVVVSAWLMEGSKKCKDFPGNLLSFGLLCITVSALLLQPDLGMTIVVTVVWGFQLFLTGIPMLLIMAIIVVLCTIGLGAYLAFDHVQFRINTYLSSIFSPENGLPYQIRTSLKAFENGNLLGKGPGEGVVKLKLPDAHTDFIFSVAGEEFGVVLCTILVILFSVVVIRTLVLSTKENNLFIVYASAGLAASFGLQAIVNMASSTSLGPTKGMTLPFVSYGGSSLLASALCIGMLLAITRKNSAAEDKDF